MDLYISNLDARLTKEKLRESLAHLLARFDMDVFEVRKAVGRPFATLTILDASKGNSLLAQAQVTPNLLLSPSGRAAAFSVSRKPIDQHWLRVLRKEEKDRQSSEAWQKFANIGEKSKALEPRSSLEITTLQCGRFETRSQRPVFTPYFTCNIQGRLTRTGRALVISLDSLSGKSYDLVIDLSSILALAGTGSGTSSTLMVTLGLSPRLYEDMTRAAEGPLLEAFGAMALGVPAIRRFRDSTLPGLSAAVIGSCLTYSIRLSTSLKDLEHRIKSMVFQTIPITIRPAKYPALPAVQFSEQIDSLKTRVSKMGFSFACMFQIHALWTNGLLAPAEVTYLLPAMNVFRNRSGEAALITALRKYQVQLPQPDASTDCKTAGVRRIRDNLTSADLNSFEKDSLYTSNRDEVSIHRVTVTPTGAYLYGPELVATNRVLRQYRAHADCFLRVIFSDENGERLEFERDTSNERILQGRFLSLLRRGLDIAGTHFDFLGFSHSSLRSQSCWFMRPFIHEGSLLFAKELISKLGDFSEIRSPAKCAARIGQAFSETSSAVRVNERIVQVDPDIKNGDYIFTDGCGTMSKSTWKLLRGNSRLKDQPTSYQIRYKGAKGMLTVDSRLDGEQIRLRESMVKFRGSPSDELEICGTNARALPFKLNRQIVKILEDLGVRDEVFEKLQEQAIERLRLSASSRSVALDFVSQQLSDSASGLPTLLRYLARIGVDATEDDFLREILGALLQIQLREIKYRTRILVPMANTLYGISDETGWLKEGEVFVTFIDEKTKDHCCLNGSVAVTRSPALHPGDVQVVQAKAPPKDSSLWDLRNCIAFSQHGRRDLPSMLSGGDLDGDLFNIIYDEELIPPNTYSPAAYLPVKPVDIGRAVTAEDMQGFFVDFMQNDQLGRIANLHQVFADIDGTFSSECIRLAELHSSAVDFSKSGVPVDIKQIPRAPPYRPDFMAPSASTKVEKGIKRPKDLAPPKKGQTYRYYESEKILGRLYRAVDEDAFFDDLEDDTSSLFSKTATDNVLAEILDWVLLQIGSSRIRGYHNTAENIKEHYESTVLEIMSVYAVGRTEQLTEKEVLIGSILGRSGASSKSQREQSDYMKRRFNSELRNLRSFMERQTDDDPDEFVTLAAACLDVAVNGSKDPNVNLRSFGWFAAGLCVPEIVKEQDGSVYDLETHF
ncbi:hypothetical protein PV08_02154 [Exophiala spinifera]|uniref:RNA-dependent RNA polymerase n=1 Tax=Exophiala spinifera TaxID=91928 RepID=A0A0D2CDH1_9EURO|nr:uncharacterized protein PV08_02154 [Exophiala spinifera]KIW21574.1 hypothetical protein PV08_02154 [Exophiala spinifera]